MRMDYRPWWKWESSTLDGGARGTSAQTARATGAWWLSFAPALQVLTAFVTPILSGAWSVRKTVGTVAACELCQVPL